MRQQGHYIRSLCLVGLAELVAERSGELALLLAECGLPVESLRNCDMLIPFRNYMTLLELVSRRFAVPELGLAWTRRMEPHMAHTGPLLALARFTATIGQWLQDALAYWSFHTNAFTFAIEEARPGVSVVRLVGAERLVWPRQVSEHALANMVALIRHAAETPDDAPLVVRFQHRPPADQSALAEFFGCPVEFDCDATEFELRSDILARETGQLQTPLRGIVRRYVQYRIDRMEFYDVAVATNVALTISSLLGTGKTDIASIAEVLNLHPKKLQRLLAQEGTSYSAVLAEVRRSMALDLMANSSAPVGQVAGLLGYANNAPFTAAFRGWTGTGPLQWRKQHRAKPVEA